MIFCGYLDPYGNALLAIGIIILLTAALLGASDPTFVASVFWLPVIALGYGAIVAAAVCSSSVLYKFKSKFTATLATLSYSIYLIHKMIITVAQNIFGQLGVDKNSNLMFIIGIICSVAGALLLRYLVEKPFLRIRDKILKSWRDKNAAPYTVKL